MPHKHVMSCHVCLTALRVKVEKASFDWATLKRYRDRYIQRLNGIYESGLDRLEVGVLLTCDL